MASLFTGCARCGTPASITYVSGEAWEAGKEGSGRAWDKTKEVSGDAWDTTSGMLQGEEATESGSETDANQDPPVTTPRPLP